MSTTTAHNNKRPWWFVWFVIGMIVLALIALFSLNADVILLVVCIEFILLNSYYGPKAAVKHDFWFTEVPPPNHFKVIAIRGLVTLMLCGDPKTLWGGPTNDEWTSTHHEHKHTGFPRLMHDLFGAEYVGPNADAKVFDFLYYELLINNKDAENKDIKIDLEKDHAEQQTTLRIAARKPKLTNIPMRFSTSMIVRLLETKGNLPAFFVIDLVIFLENPQKYLYFGPVIGSGGLQQMQKLHEAQIKKYAEGKDIPGIILEDTTKVSGKDDEEKAKSFQGIMFDSEFLDMVAKITGARIEKTTLTGFGAEGKKIAEALESIEVANLLKKSKIITAEAAKAVRLLEIEAEQQYITDVVTPIFEKGGAEAVTAFFVMNNKNIHTLALGGQVPFAITAPGNPPTGEPGTQGRTQPGTTGTPGTPTGGGAQS